MTITVEHTDFVSVPVTDMERSIAFYRDTLGLEVRNDVANEGYRWISVGSPAQPDVTIVLTNYVNGGPDDGAIIGPNYARKQCEQLGAPPVPRD